MTEELIVKERVADILRLGESHFREFKSAFEGPPENKKPRSLTGIRKDIAEAIVAFANADGGDLIVGVEDTGEISGVPYSPDKLAILMKAPEEMIQEFQELPLLASNALTLDDKKVLLFSVSKASTRIFQLTDGRCMRRSGTQTLPADVQKILFDQQEMRSREWDSEFVNRARLTDLNIELVSEQADIYLKDITPERYLQNLGLAEYAPGGLRLRRAALLLFASKIEKWHPRCQVRIIEVLGAELREGKDYNVNRDQTIEANIVELIPKTMLALRGYLSSRTSLTDRGLFEPNVIYPERACLEVIVNAVAHRDYSLYRPIEIFVYDDRIAISSPGALLSTITVEDLLRLEGAHESRNGLTTRALRESAIMRELGEGIRRIFALMTESDRKQPELQAKSNSFSVILFQQSIYNEKQLAWLGLFEEFELSRKQKRIIVAGIEGRKLSPSDIYRAMKTNDRDTYDQEVTQLRNSNILVTIRTNAQALRMARKTGRKKQSIARFRVQTPPEDPEERIVVVFGLPEGVGQSEVESLMARFGELILVTLKLDHAGNPYAFVEYREQAMAERALRGSGLFLRSFPLTVKARKRR